MKKISLAFLKIIGGIFLFYAVIFSIMATIFLIGAYGFVMQPVKQIKALVTKNPNESTYMFAHRTKLRQQKKSDALQWSFTPIDSISPYLQQAVIAAEDDGFYTHPGFDIEAILEAMAYNRRIGSIKRGASTITQQLAKNLFLSNEKTFWRKYRELVYTILMEKYLGKKRILELYLNYAQWGPSMFGCESASRYYFHKSSKSLTRNESARMAAVLAAPTKMSPVGSSEFLGKRLEMIANNLYLHGQAYDSAFRTIAEREKADSAAREGGMMPETGQDW